MGGNAENLNFSGGSSDQSAKDLDGCGLSRAVWAKKLDDFPFFHVKRNARKGLYPSLSGGIVLYQVFHED